MTTAYAGGWIRPEPGTAQSYPPPLPPLVVPGPVFALPLVSIIFFAGLFLGIAGAVVVVLFALGIINVRAWLLMNRLPPAKIAGKASLP